MIENELDFRLLNECQKGFPLCPAPFAELAQKLGVAEATVLRMLETLRREGRIARVGAVFAPKRIGASSLATISVPPDRLRTVAAAVNRFPEVNQNYLREHRYNLWFVVTAGSPGRLQAALGAIEQAAGLPVVSLPLLAEYLAGSPGNAVTHEELVEPVTALDEIGRRLVMALQEGLPFFIRPFSVLASRVGCDENEVIERIRNWCATGIIKRFGLVVRSPAVQGAVSALLVLDVPDDDVAACCELLAGESGVSACHHRSRSLPDWPFNVFCTVVGRSVPEIKARIDAFCKRPGLAALESEVLFSSASLGK